VVARNLGGSDFPRAGATRQDITELFEVLSNWGRWGAHDELGALNLITPEKRRAAAALVKTGVPVSLSREAIKQQIGVSAPFEHTMVTSGDTPDAEGAADIFSVQFHGYTQTHLDALCHIFYGDAMFNGISKQTVTAQGATKMSVVTMKDAIMTRGVLMDMPRLFGSQYLRASDAIYPEHLDAWLARTGIVLESGDALVVRTGRWSREAAEGPWDVELGSAGLHAACLRWLRKHDIAVLVGDLASDLMPSRVEGVRMPIHLVTIASLGVPIIDNCDLESLSQQSEKQQQWDFFFMASPLVVPGGTGSPINPIALF
jgi:kynurenine formamidase